MKQIRLLPIVVFAAVALLAFKTIGLVTEGGYILVGGAPAEAAEGGGGEGAAAQAGGTDITIPEAPTLVDDAPVLADSAPVVQLAPDAPEGGHSEAKDTAADHASATEAAPAVADAGMPAQPVEGHLPDENCGADTQCATNGGTPPVVIDATGDKTDNAADTEKQLLARLADRRSELDALANELDMRSSLVAAAEKRLDERTAELKAMEDRINAVVDAQKAAEDEQFKSLVSMYETMKPNDAARIFDALDIDVLLRVGRAMNPRKMAPIMAKMNPQAAQVLTTLLAAADTFDIPAQPAPNDPGALPQIVGH